MLSLEVIFTKFFVLSILTSPAKEVEGSLELLLLHTNDLRASLEGTDSQTHGTKVGGYPRIAHAISQARKRAKDNVGPPVLYLDAGDTYTDNLWSNQFTRKILIEFTNLLHPDAAVLGCHDFHNVEVMEEFLQKIRFPIVASNLHFTRDIERYASKVRPHLILEIANMVIGIVGYITPKMHVFDDEDNGAYVEIEDELESVAREVEHLKKRNVSFIIALGHSGYHVDRRIAREVDGIDLIIGGLSHGLYWNDPQPPNDERIKGTYPYIVENTRNGTKKVPILHTYGFSKYLGKVLVKFDPQTGLVDYIPDPLFLHHSLPEDSDTLELIKVYKRAVDKVENSDEVLAECIVPLDAENIRKEESNLANIVTDAMVYHMIERHAGHRDGFWTETAVSLINAGAIRKSIDTKKASPNITRGMIKEIMPYRQPLVELKVKGSDIVESLETGVRSNGETSRGEFLQFSGLRVFYNYDKPAGYRVAFVRIRCAECAQPTFGKLEKHNVYSIVVTAFIANGGDGHITFKSKAIKRHLLNYIYDIDVLVRLLENIRNIRPEADERIQELRGVRKKRYNSSMNRGDYRKIVWRYDGVLLLLYTCIYFYFRSSEL